MVWCGIVSHHVVCVCVCVRACDYVALRLVSWQKHHKELSLSLSRRWVATYTISFFDAKPFIGNLQNEK